MLLHNIVIQPSENVSARPYKDYYATRKNQIQDHELTCRSSVCTHSTGPKLICNDLYHTKRSSSRQKTDGFPAISERLRKAKKKRTILPQFWGTLEQYSQVCHGNSVEYIWLYACKNHESAIFWSACALRLVFYVVSWIEQHRQTLYTSAPQLYSWNYIWKSWLQNIPRPKIEKLRINEQQEALPEWKWKGQRVRAS